jgi:hypothetical protein
MTAANDCELVRVFPRSVGGDIADETIKSNEAFQVVLEAEAGQTLFDNGGPYSLSLVVRDESAGVVVNNANQAGSFQDLNWSDLAMEFVFPDIPAQGAANVDHIYRAIAVIRAGVANPIVSFAESELFVITPP